MYSSVISQTIDLGFSRDLKYFTLLPSCSNSGRHSTQAKAKDYSNLFFTFSNNILITCFELPRYSTGSQITRCELYLTTICNFALNLELWNLTRNEGDI